MSYSSIALMAEDQDLKKRIIACASREGLRSADMWAMQNMWLVVSTPGWDDAWDSALVVGIGRPGNMPNVISDAMILSAVQPRISSPEGA